MQGAALQSVPVLAPVTVGRHRLAEVFTSWPQPACPQAGGRSRGGYVAYQVAKHFLYRHRWDPPPRPTTKR